jgi:hypothetical protein
MSKPTSPSLSFFAAALMAATLATGCATQPLPYQSVDASAVDEARLAQAKQTCKHDETLKQASRKRADGVAVARYGGASSPQAQPHFEEAARLRQQVWDCMKAQGFVLPAR